MSGTFSSFGSALSSLRYNRVAMDVASSNMANAHTAGYTRRTALAQATGAPAVPALWSRWDGASGGVELGGIQRMVDPLLSARSRTEHASLTYVDTRAASLVRFETSLREPGENGVAAALDQFKAGWHDVANNPGDEASRSQLLGRAHTLVGAIRSQADALSTEWSDQRTKLDSVITEANQAAVDLAKLNKALKAADNAGTDANTLLDQRDKLALRLAELTGATTTVNKDSTVTVMLAGKAFVAGDGTAGKLAVPGSPGDNDELAERDSVTVQLTGADGTTAELTTYEKHGEIGGALQLLKKDLPDYVNRLDAVTSTLITEVNELHAGGVDRDGNAGVDFFRGSGLTDIAVNLENPRQVAAADDGVGGLDGSNATALGNAPLGADAYRRLITDFGVKVASAERVATNQAVLTAQVDASWESLAGVNIDEEMVNLLAAQRAYEGAARVITTLDSVLDTLINRTGVTR